MSPRFRSRTIDDIAADLDKVRGERRQYVRDNNRPFAEDLVDRAERVVADARGRAEQMAFQFGVDGFPPPGSAPAVAFAEAVTIAGAGDLIREGASQAAALLPQEPTKAEFTSKLAGYDAKVAEFEAELRDAERQAAHDAIDVEFGAGMPA